VGNAKVFKHVHAQWSESRQQDSDGDYRTGPGATSSLSPGSPLKVEQYKIKVLSDEIYFPSDSIN